ncbi:MAG TPA: hypothetical protein VFQ65_19415, partial [Kofleriaceae bacterium]|nr:hypothetical protein [Kofleriaceae bacterium]
QRPPAMVDAYLDRAATDPLELAPGADHLDPIIAAFASVGGTPNSPTLAWLLDRFVQLVAPKKHRALARRAAVTLLDWIARHRDAAPAARHGLLAVAVAFEPRSVGFPEFHAGDAAAAAYGLVRYAWPCKTSVDQTKRLMTLPIATADLALCAALAGLLPAKRLTLLADAFGGDALVAALLAGDHGWAEICALPGETPALELAWLAWVEKHDYKRYIALAGRAVATYSGPRLDAFVEQMPRRHRPPAFLAALRAQEHAEPARLAAVCKVIAARIDRAGLTALLEAVLALPDRALRRTFVLALIRPADDKLLAQAVIPLDEATVLRLIEALDDPEDPPPRGRELAIGEALRSRMTPAVHRWLARIKVGEVPLAVISAPAERRALTSAERAMIMSASPADLAHALAPAFKAPVTGLATALAVVGANPNAAACAALMGCADPIVDVARQLDRFAGASEAAIDREMAPWRHQPDLPALANAFLFRWEAHLLALQAWIAVTGTVHETLRAIDALGDGFAGRTLWQGVSEVVMFWRYRNKEHYDREATIELAQFCAERVDRPIGRHAARIVVALVEGKAVAVTAVRDRVLDRIADADAETREYAARLIRLEGVPAPRPVVREPGSADLIATIRKTTNLDALVQWCAHPQPAIVEEAVLALLVLGARGQLQLAELLDHLGDLLHPLPIVASIQLWEEPAAVERARALATIADLPTAWRFYVNLALAARGEPGALDAAFAAARTEAPTIERP